MGTDDLQERYRRRLACWPQAMRRYLYELPDRRGLACFGPGDHGHWAVQANATAAAAFAVLATEPGLDTAQAGMSRDELLNWALCLVRFSLFSHRAGGGVTTDGLPWGHSWISALSLERMMHGLDALAEHLTPEDHDRLRDVLVSECNWLLDEYRRDPSQAPGTIAAGVVNHNHPENNIWNGCLLHRTVRLFPDVPRREAYLEKGTAFLLNGISVATDAAATELVAGRQLSAWHVGANFFPSYALNHHGYLNVGYMVICLSNIAMLHFACRARGWQVPEGLYHHARELWQLVKTCTFPDGRLWRVGGDTRVRYCYCQDYAVPAWLLARDLFGDTEANGFEAGWLGILETEAAANGDGSFLGARLAPLAAASPLYYTRLEGDRAVSLSMGAYWHRRHESAVSAVAVAAPAPITVLTDWSDEYHGSLLVRGAKRLASWTWRAAESPQGHCLPVQASSMAEWQGNLGGCVRGLGLQHEIHCEPTQLQAFPGGFATCGRAVVRSRQPLAEGDADYDAAAIDLACVALPDDRTLVVLQRARVGTRTWLRTVKGLFLQVPNDIFNGGQRTAVTASGEFRLRGCPGTAQTLPLDGDWLNLDGCLSVVRLYGPPLCIHQPAQRQIAIRGKEQGGGHLHADEICCGCREGTEAFPPGTVLFDLAAAVLAGVDAEATRTLAAETSPAACPCPGSEVRVVTLRGGDGRRYWIVANFGTAPAEAPLREAAGSGLCALAGCTIVGDRNRVEVAVEPGRAGLVVAAS